MIKRILLFPVILMYAHFSFSLPCHYEWQANKQNDFSEQIKNVNPNTRIVLPVQSVTVFCAGLDVNQDLPEVEYTLSQDNADFAIFIEYNGQSHEIKQGKGSFALSRNSFTKVATDKFKFNFTFYAERRDTSLSGSSVNYEQMREIAIDMAIKRRPTENQLPTDAHHIRLIYNSDAFSECRVRFSGNSLSQTVDFGTVLVKDLKAGRFPRKTFSLNVENQGKSQHCAFSLEFSSLYNLHSPTQIDLNNGTLLQIDDIEKNKGMIFGQENRFSLTDRNETINFNALIKPSPTAVIKRGAFNAEIIVKIDYL